MVGISIIIGMILMVVGLVTLGVYFKIRYHISFTLLGVGTLSFLITTQFFERILHIFVLRPDQTGTSYLMRDLPFLYVIYGVLVAAVFEETARYVIFRFIQRKRQLEFKDALAYGLGHGGIEMIVVGLLSLLNLFVLYQAVTQNPAQLTNLLPQATIDSIANTPVWSPYILVLERFMALAGQMMLTIWVWKAVSQHHYRLFAVALAFHALIDLAPAMSQVGWIRSPLLVEAIVLLAIIVLGYFTRKLLK